MIDRDRIVRACLFALAYFAGSELGYALSLGPSVGGTFWPPAGISLAVFLAAPSRTWPLLLAAGALANFLSDQIHGQVFAASVGFALANLSEPVVAALVLRRVLGAPVTFSRLPDIVAMALVAMFVSAPLGATIGAVTAQWFTANPPEFSLGWRTWWVGDCVATLVLTPFVFRTIAAWHRLGAMPLRRVLEGAAFAATVWVVTYLVFSVASTSVAMPLLVFPVLLWGAVRLGLVAVGAALCLIVAVTAHDTAAGYGPFAAEHLSLADRLVALQIYIGVMAISFHGLAVLWEERTRTAAALKAAHSGLEARYRRIIEQSPLAIIAVQPDGQVRDVNPAWRRLRAPGSPSGATDPVPPP